MCFLPSSIRVLSSTALDGHGEVGIVTTLIRDTEGGGGGGGGVRACQCYSR